MDMKQFTLKSIQGHFEIFCDGEFYASADTLREAFHEIAAAKV